MSVLGHYGLDQGAESVRLTDHKADLSAGRSTNSIVQYFKILKPLWGV